MLGRDRIAILTLVYAVAAVAPVTQARCVSCDLVPCGECQEGCTKSTLGCEEDSRNGGKDHNKGLSPSHCLAPSASFCAESGWTQVWGDEFNGSEVDTASWTKDVGPPGDSMTRTAAATATNVYIEDGSLVLRSDGTMSKGSWTNLTSGAVHSKGKRFFGGKASRVCVRAKLPGGGGSGKGAGIWPAHWLMPENATCYNEIDIMEMVKGSGTAYGTYWWGDGDCKHANQKVTSSVYLDDFATSFHEYAVEFDGESHVTFAIDGKPYATVTNASHAAQPPHGGGKFYDYNWYVILNTAVGGAWPGNVQATTVLPTYHYIDYVRVAEQAAAGIIV